MTSAPGSLPATSLPIEGRVIISVLLDTEGWWVDQKRICIWKWFVNYNHKNLYSNIINWCLVSKTGLTTGRKICWHSLSKWFWQSFSSLKMMKLAFWFNLKCNGFGHCCSISQGMFGLGLFSHTSFGFRFELTDQTEVVSPILPQLGNNHKMCIFKIVQVHWTRS